MLRVVGRLLMWFGSGLSAVALGKQRRLGRSATAVLFVWRAGGRNPFNRWRKTFAGQSQLVSTRVVQRHLRQQHWSPRVDCNPCWMQLLQTTPRTHGCPRLCPSCDTWCDVHTSKQPINRYKTKSGLPTYCKNTKARSSRQLPTCKTAAQKAPCVSRAWPSVCTAQAWCPSWEAPRPSHN